MRTIAIQASGANMRFSITRTNSRVYGRRVLSPFLPVSRRASQPPAPNRGGSAGAATTLAFAGCPFSADFYFNAPRARLLAPRNRQLQHTVLQARLDLSRVESGRQHECTGEMRFTDLGVVQPQVGRCGHDGL